LASVTSSCAAAATAVKLGLIDGAGPITVQMPGGDLLIEVSAEFAVRMTGPTRRVGTMTLDRQTLDDAVLRTKFL